MTIPLIIHHGNCVDGFTAAWWLGKNLGEHDKYAANYNEACPLELVNGLDRDVYVVDFCYPPDELGDLGRAARSVVILDHHQTARGWLEETVDYTVVDGIELWQQEGSGDDHNKGLLAVFDMEHSGAMLVAYYVAHMFGRFAPEWITEVEARDLWRQTDLTPNVFAAISSHDYTDANWDAIAPRSTMDLFLEGGGINRFRNKLIDQTVDTAYQTLIGGHEVWIAASSYMVGSDVAGILAARNPELFGAYYVDYGYKVKVGLRSTEQGMDVAELAALWPPGGGHKHASGFEVGDLAHCWFLP